MDLVFHRKQVDAACRRLADMGGQVPVVVTIRRVFMVQSLNEITCKGVYSDLTLLRQVDELNASILLQPIRASLRRILPRGCVLVVIDIGPVRIRNDGYFSKLLRRSKPW
jgi:hypothetical protein